MEASVALEDVTRGFDEGGRRHRVLERVTASFGRGETVALRGRSGSGKSTLLNLVSGIDLPDSGRIVVAGTDITALGETDRTLFRRRHIGFVYQAFNLVPTLSVGDNIRLVLELNGVGVGESDERIRELLGAVELGDRAGSFPDVLSGGEQQRVAIARALAHRPALVLADEPTGNLDEKTADTVLRLLNDLVEREGSTMIMATHSASIATTCDRIVELHDGRLQETERAAP